MKMKRIISVLLVTILTMSLFVGCAAEELSFYKISRQLNDLVISKPVRSEGRVSLTLDELPEALLESDMEDSEAEIMSEVLSFINDHSFVYTMDSDTVNDKTVAQFDLSSNDGDEVTPLLTVIRNTGMTYVKLDDYFDAITNMVSTFATEEEATEVVDEMDKLVGDIEYLSVSDEELITFYSNMLSTSLGDQEETDMFMEQLEAQLDPEAKKKQSEAYLDFVDQLMEEVYKNYSLNIIQKEDNNKYSMTLDADNLGDTVIGFLDYSLENNEVLTATVKDYLQNLSDQEYSLLVGAYAVEMMNREMLVDAVEEISDDLAENKEGYKEQLAQGIEMYNDMFKAYIEGSKLQITLGEDDGIFNRDIVLKVQVNDPLSQSVTFDATMVINETFEEIDAFEVKLPTENVITFTEFLNRVPKTMQIHVDYDMYTMVNLAEGELGEMGSINTIIKDGRSYLPTRMIAEAFGETIDWDDTLKKPYIVKDGVNVYIDEFIIEDSVSYVKVREFEKFDYVIRWDEDLRMITIEK